ncbi:MAG TPA: TonB-dependent receptor [Bacteroidales bacterium]|nr:TonB-dependent receptor [Bacteroidales bacterium]
MLKKLIVFILLIAGTGTLCAQTRYTLSGYVREKGTHELLPGVNIYVPSLRNGTVTNNYGFYSLSLPEGTCEVIFSYIGYQTVSYQIVFDQNRDLEVNLSGSIALSEVTITAEEITRNSENSQMSMVVLPVQQIKNIPAFLGEKDVFKALQLMPGVQKGSEGSSGLYVRGGGPDQNLIILDDAPVYNASHLFGFFSIFNGDALKSIELTKGGFPARFGGRLSSVVEMTMKDGNKTKLSGEAGIGLISSRLLLEGPIIKEKASFIVSARRTYIDALIRPMMPRDEKFGYYFYDLNAKVNYDFGRKDKLYLSGYFGRDKFSIVDRGNYYDEFNQNQYSTEAGLYWQNATSTIRWNHLFNNKVFANTSAIFSRYNLTIYDKEKDNSGTYSLKYYSGIRDFALKYDLEYHATPTYTLRTGIQTTQHRFTPSAVVEKDSQTLENFDQKTIYDSFESGLYAENQFNFGGKAQLNAGFRLSHFAVDGEYYLAPEPRMSFNFILSKGFSAKAAYAEMNQYIHLLSNTGIGLPTDLWVPSTTRVKPQNSRQLSAGLARDLNNPGLSVTLEGYYKWSKNILGYKPGASFLLIDDPSEARNFTWQDNVTAGKSLSYGAELLIHKKTGRFSGWIGYTLSWTKLKFDEINFGEYFWAKYDRRHDLSVVAIYEINPRVTLSGTWVYGTGNAITLPQADFPVLINNPIENLLGEHFSGYYYYPQSVTDYGRVNSYRIKAYHRLDLSVQFHKQMKRWERTWEFGLYNAYSRKNPFFYFIDETYTEYGSRSTLKQVSIFPIIPSVSYNIKF